MQNKTFDVIVIGCGPSGISCAIYLKRFNFNVLVIGKKSGSLAYNTIIDNYYGVPHINGNDLLETGINQAKALGIDVIEDEVVDINIGDNSFEVTTANDFFVSKKIFIGVGNNRKNKKYINLDKFIGNGVSYCATCDGFFYRNRRIAIIGSGALMEHEKQVLERFTSDIIVLNENDVIGFDGESSLKTVILKDKSIDVDACFIAEGTASLTTFAVHLGLLTDNNNYLIVDDNFMTNINGIYAGGDAIGGFKQVFKAVYDGAMAAYCINNMF